MKPPPAPGNEESLVTVSWSCSGIHTKSQEIIPAVALWWLTLCVALADEPGDIIFTWISVTDLQNTGKCLCHYVLLRTASCHLKVN